MKYGLLEERDTFQENDEMFSPMSCEWSLVPAQWFGMKVSYDDNNTFSRFKVQCRRALKTAVRQPTAPNTGSPKLPLVKNEEFGFYYDPAVFKVTEKFVAEMTRQLRAGA